MTCLLQTSYNRGTLINLSLSFVSITPLSFTLNFVEHPMTLEECNFFALIWKPFLNDGVPIISLIIALTFWHPEDSKVDVVPGKGMFKIRF